MRTRVVMGYLGAGLAAAASLVLLSAGRVASGMVCGLAGLAAVVAMVRGSRTHVPDDTAGWHLLSAGVLALVVGEVLGSLFATRTMESGPTPADVLRITGYVLTAAGVVRIQRPDRSEPRGARAIEAALVALGLGLMVWQVAVGPILGRTGPTPTDRALAIAYPALTLGVVAVAAWAGVALRRPTRSQLFLGLGLLGLLAAEMFMAAGGGATGPTASAATRMGAFLLLGAAALDPSLGSSDPSPASFGRVRLALLGVATLLGPASLMLRTPRAVAMLPFTTASVALLILLLMRTRLLVRQHDTADAALHRAANDLRATEADRRRLLSETMQAGERQRAEIAYELHDGPIQRLAAIGYTLDRAVMAMQRGDGDAMRALLDTTTESLRHEVSNLRALMVALRPPALDEQGLEDALRDQASAFTRQTGVPCVVQSDLRERLAADLEVLLYRVSQEALRNVAKHANASRAGLRLGTSNGSVQLEVRDDGAGFDLWRIRDAARSGHVGLLSMREQVELAGGTWRIDSRPGAGTRVQATIPRRSE